MRRIALRFRPADHFDPARAQTFDRRLEDGFLFRAIEHGDGCAFVFQQVRGRRSAQSGSEHCYFSIGVTHELYLSLSVASPSSAKIAERIQNRTMTVFSFHPLSSK